MSEATASGSLIFRNRQQNQVLLSRLIADQGVGSRVEQGSPEETTQVHMTSFCSTQGRTNGIQLNTHSDDRTA